MCSSDLKVAGSLVECATSDRHVDWVILGVGVNVNVTRGALQAALGKASHAAGSLAEAARREIDRNAFAAAFLNLVGEGGGEGGRVLDGEIRLSD